MSGQCVMVPSGQHVTDVTPGDTRAGARPAPQHRGHGDEAQPGLRKVLSDLHKLPHPQPHPFHFADHHEHIYLQNCEFDFKELTLMSILFTPPATQGLINTFSSHKLTPVLQVNKSWNLHRHREVKIIINTYLSNLVHYINFIAIGNDGDKTIIAKSKFLFVCFYPLLHLTRKGTKNILVCLYIFPECLLSSYFIIDYLSYILCTSKLIFPFCDQEEAWSTGGRCSWHKSASPLSWSSSQG